MSKSRQPNYWDYIRVEELLGLQGGLEADEDRLENDEVLFITVHQVFELWFKLILREMRTLRDVFREGIVAEQGLADADRSLRRISTLLRRCADHFQVMETLTTRSYLSFRDKLMPASGFQSAQMRQIEIVMGLRDEERISLGGESSFMDALRAHDGSESSAWKQVAQEKDGGPSLARAVSDWLSRTPIDGIGPEDDGAAAALDQFVEAYTAAHSSEVDKTAAIAHERFASAGDSERLDARYAAEKETLVSFMNPGADEGGATRRWTRAAMLFILGYRELPLLAWPREILDGLIEMEQVFVVFRQRHARMVERVIGRRTGTGGSSGVDYLDQTALSYRVFRDLWAVRTFQMRQGSNPPLTNPGFYGFKNG